MTFIKAIFLVLAAIIAAWSYYLLEHPKVDKPKNETAIAKTAVDKTATAAAIPITQEELVADWSGHGSHGKKVTRVYFPGYTALCVESSPESGYYGISCQFIH